MKIATWNVNSIRTRLEHVEMWIKSHNPDVLLLQEIKAMEATFPFEALEDLGYNIKIHGQKSYNGVAILSKRLLEDVTLGFPGNEDDPGARYIEAVTGNVRVVSVYVPNGQDVTSDKYPYKLTFLNRLRDHLKTLLTYQEMLVVGGDYNIAPMDMDIYDTAPYRDHIFITPPERSAFREILNLGMVDAYRVLHPDLPGYTWWDYRQGSFPKNEGLRIDHLLLSSQAADALTECDVDVTPRGYERPSDHAPLWCRVNG